MTYHHPDHITSHYLLESHGLETFTTKGPQVELKLSNSDWDERLKKMEEQMTDQLKTKENYAS